MRLLVDTHVFLWCISNDKKLSKKAKSRVLEADEIYVSAASIWEIAIKVKLKKLDVNVKKLADAIAESGFKELAITAVHAIKLMELGDFHRDPFDRMIIAQCLSEPLTLLTHDPILKKYTELVELV